MKQCAVQAKPSEAEQDRLPRRAFLGAVGVAGFALAAPSVGQRGDQVPSLARPSGPAHIVSRDESYWQRVAAHYRISSAFTNLEAGFWGMMSSPVMAEYHRQLERVNRESSFYARGEYTQDLQNARARVAAALGADINEIALSRGATEALQCLIGGYNRLKPGDAVIYADLDYPAMQYAMNWLADRRGVRVVRIAIPEPATRDNVLGAYRAALDANPDVRLLLLTHVNNKTGLILPVATITEFARRRNVDVIVDAAHSWVSST